MSAPRWARALVGRLADPAEADEVVGDLEEAHRIRVGRHGRVLASVLTALEALDVAWALLRTRGEGTPPAPGSARARVRRTPRLPWISWVDVKLGARLLVKHPGLSLVSTLGMTVAVGMGVAAFAVIRGMTSSPLPLSDGERIVAVQNVGPWGMERAASTHLHAMEAWRREVGALEALGAYRTLTRNVIATDGAVAPARITEMTASGFAVAGVPPLMGRRLVEADEAEGAASVLVIGHGVWQDRFGGSPDVLGRTLRIGATRHVIVGVMPPGFAFPVNDRMWAPLRLDPDDHEPGRAPPVWVFGRLAPDAGLEEAALQVAAVTERMAAAYPETHEDLTGQVVSYKRGQVSGPMAWAFYLVQLVVALLLAVIVINVAALVYARTAARVGEIAVRTALGASRGRIVTQLVAEAFLLSSVATVLGLGFAGLATERIGLHIRGGGDGAPFWWTFGLTPEAVAYAFGLALLASLVIGVIPALGATGSRLRGRLQAAGGAASGPGLGRTWTALIVGQIAVAVAIMPVALGGVVKWSRTSGGVQSTLPLDEVVFARLVLDEEGSAPDVSSALYRTMRDELVRRLEADPAVARVAPTGIAPWEDPDESFELEGGTVMAREEGKATLVLESASSGHRVGRSEVTPEFFEALGLRAQAGRLLRSDDAVAEGGPVVVNETFVRLVMRGANPLGRRIRYLTSIGQPTSAWHTIVGVVPDWRGDGLANAEATAYRALGPEEVGRGGLVVRVSSGGEAARLEGRLREVAAQLDPRLRLADLTTVEAMYSDGTDIVRSAVLVLAGLSVAVLLLAIAGLYALMSFTVQRRYREIGIRVALGARPHSVLGSVLGRTAWQLGLGIAAGLAFAGAVDRLVGGEILGREVGLILPFVALLMTAIGVLAAWAPTRRGLQVQPTEALRAE